MTDSGGSTMRRVTELRHKAGADPSEWPADLRVQNFPAMR